MRRRFATLCLVLLVALSGCSAVVGDALTLAASPATVPDEAAAEHGFAEPTLRNQTLPVGRLAGAPVNVSLDVWVSRTVRLPDAVTTTADGDPARNGTALTVVSLPQAKVAGVPTNPLATAPLASLLTRFTRAGNVTQVGERSVPILGEERTVTTFRTGGEREGRVHVARVRHGTDVVVVIGVVGSEQDDAAVRSLVERIEHETG